MQNAATAHRVAHHLLNNGEVVWHTSVTNSPKAEFNCFAFVELPVLNTSRQQIHI